MPSKEKLRKQKEKEEQKEKLEEEMRLNKYWDEGTNKRAEKREQLEQEKQMQKMQKMKEKKELEEADNNDIKNINVKIKKIKKKKGDDLDMLNEALKNAPKTKSQREFEQKQFEKLQKKKEANTIFTQRKIQTEILENEKQLNIQKGMSYEHNNVMNNEIHNTLEENEEFITGIDNILDTFSSDKTITYNSFYQQQLPIVKNEYPGLRLTQYQEKINALWKKSPLNKVNQT
jgi:hypothetical protein